MVVQRKLRSYLRTVLPPGEEATSVTEAALRAFTARDGAVGWAAMVPLTAVAGSGRLDGMLVPMVWVVSTPREVLIVGRRNAGRDVGDLVLRAPVGALTATVRRPRVKYVVTLTDPATGNRVVALHVGVRRRAASRIAAAVNGRPGGRDSVA